MQTFGAYVADVHRRALAHGFQAFKHLNITGTVGFFFF